MAWRLKSGERDFITTMLDTFEGSKFIGMLPAGNGGQGDQIMENETVLIQHTTATRETDKAILVKFEDSSEHWIPKSQLQPGSEVRQRGDQGDVVVSQWFADNSKLFKAGGAPRSTSSSAKRGELSNKPGRGVMFAQKAEGKQPNYKGGVNIGGREYKLAGWVERSKSGLEYLSLVIEPADVSEDRAA